MNNTLITDLKNRGYIIYKGIGYCNEVMYQKEYDDVYNVNYGKMCISTPSGEVKNIVGTLDRSIRIGRDEPPIITTRRELLTLIYEPSEEGWCRLEHHCSLRTKLFFDTAFSNIGLLSSDTFETGGSDDKTIKNATTKPFETYFVNGSADITEDKGKHIIQLHYQYEIDAFGCEQYVFMQDPNIEDFHTAYELEHLFADIRGNRIQEYENNEFWLERGKTLNYIFNEYSRTKSYITEYSDPYLPTVEKTR